MLIQILLQKQALFLDCSLKKKLTLSLEAAKPSLDFDEDFSDICLLEEIPIEDILPTILMAEEQY